MQFMRWDPLLRALYTGRPLFHERRFNLPDKRGRPLNSASRFSADFDTAVMREFRDAAGDIAGAVTVLARADDITIHIGDAMHAAPPPLAAEGHFRKSVLLSFHPDFKNHRGERHYNDVLLGAKDGQVGNLRDAVSEASGR